MKLKALWRDIFGACLVEEVSKDVESGKVLYQEIAAVHPLWSDALTWLLTPFTGAFWGRDADAGEWSLRGSLSAWREAHPRFFDPERVV